jgi:hypothetical protein
MGRVETMGLVKREHGFGGGVVQGMEARLLPGDAHVWEEYYNYRRMGYISLIVNIIYIYVNIY